MWTRCKQPHIQIKRILSSLALLLLVSSPISVQAAPNLQINYQGKITDATGSAIANGDYDAEFNLYTVASGGAAVWTETRTGGNQVSVTNGLFSVMLGEVTDLSGINFNQTLYLGVNFDSDGEMAPRKILGTVPAAFEAQQLGGLATTSFLRADEADIASNLITFSGGLVSQASSTIALLTTATATTTNLIINGDVFTDLTGSGLIESSGTLAANINESNLNIVAAPTNGFVLQASSSAVGGFAWQATSTLGLADTQLSEEQVEDFVGGMLGGTQTGIGVTYQDGTNDIDFVVDNVTAAMLNAEDFGDFSCNGANCALDANTVGVSELAPGIGLSTFGDDVGYLQDITSESFLDLTDTPVSFTNSRILYMDAGSVTSNADLSFDGSQLSLGGTGLSLAGSTANITLGSNFISGDGDDEGLFVSSTGEVGIGTTTPNYALTVSGGDIGIDEGAIIYDNEGDARITFSNFSTTIGNTSNDSFVYVPGNASIGTSSSAGRLRIESTSAGTDGTGIEVYGLTGASGRSLGYFESSENSNERYVLRVVGNAGATEGLVVTSAGNVGVGSTSPEARFHVVDSTSITSATTGGVVLVGESSSGSRLAFDQNEIQAQGASAAENLFLNRFGGQVAIGTTTAQARLSVQTNGTNDILNLYETDGEEVFTVLENGNVGIGTSSPTSTLDVWGDLRVGTSSVPLLFADSFSGQVTITDSSTTGLTPSLGANNLVIDSAGNAGISIFSDNNGTGSLLFGRQGNVSKGQIRYNHISDRFVFDQGASSIIMQNDGIAVAGTDVSPDYRLEIVGFDADVNGFFGISSTTDGDVFVVDQQGKVGIGTSSPAYTLSVEGDTIITGSLYDSTNSAGTNGQILQSTGSGQQWVSTSTLGLTDTNLTEEQVEDFVGGMLGGTQTGIGVTYQDGTNDIDFVLDTTGDWTGTLDGIEGAAFALDTDVDDLSGVTDVSAARTNLSLGALATLSSITSSEVTDDTLSEADLDLVNTPTDEYCLTYESGAGGDFEWQDCSAGTINLTDLNDVDTTGVSGGNILVYDGTNWVDQATTTFLMESEIASIAALEALIGGTDIITSAENTDTADDLSDNTTTDLAEGTNLYFTNDRVASYITSSTTISRLGQSIDISDETTLAAGTGITLTDDTLSVTAAGGLTTTTGGLTTTGVLADFNTLGAPASDGEFIVATGAGTFTYESGATARTSLGVDAAGTDNSTDVTLNTATADYLSIDGSQVITLSRLDLADDLATFTSANLAGRLTDETGTGNVVFSASPTFTGIAQFASLIANGSSTISNLTFTTATGTTLVLGGDTVTDLTGTGLTLSGTSLTTTLGTDISVGELDFDPIEEGELDTEAELESQLTGVTNVFTNNDGALTDDDLSDDAISALSDVVISAAANGQLISFNGTNWVNVATSTLGLTDTNLTEEQVEDFVGGMLGGTQTGIGVTYQDGTNDIDFVLDTTGDWTGTLDGIEGAAFALDTDVDDLSGVTDVSAARTNLSLGALATLSSITSSEVTDDTLSEADLDLVNTPTDEYCLTYESGAGGDFEWQDCSAGTINLTDLNDVDTTGVSGGNILVYDGTNWVDQATTTFLMESEIASIAALEALIGGTDIITSAENTDTADDLSDNTTTDLAEGTNLYFTNDRVASYITSSTTISRLGQSIDISDETTLAAGTGITLTDDTLSVTAAGGLTTTTGGLTTTGVLADFNTLGAPASDGEFIVATGAGTFTYESGATARTSLGVDAAGTDNSTDVTLNTATADYLSIDGSQVITLSRLDLADDLATFTSANLAGRLTDETGTGNVVFSASPTFTGIAQFASLIANGSSTISNLTFTTATGTTLVLGGDTVTDLTGTGLTLSGTSLTTTLGTDISVGELDFDPIEEGELDTEAELESQLTGVTNVFTNNDGALTDDDLSDDAISALSDVVISAAANGQLISFNGTNWVNVATSTLGLTDTNLTEEQVEDFVGGMLGGTQTGIGVTYQDGTNDIDFVLDTTGDWTGTLDGIEGAAFALDTDVDDLSGVTDVSAARTNLSLGALATLSSITSSEVTDDTLSEADLDLVNTPTDEYCLTYESGAGGDFEWQDCSAGTINLTDLNDVDTTGVSGGNILVYDGTNWVDQATTTFLMESEIASIAALEALIGGTDIITSAENTDTADDLSDNTTTDLAEGTNLYFTNDRVASYITSSTTISRLGQSIDISDETTLAAGTGITLTDDTLSVTAAGGLTTTTGGLTTTGVLADFNTLGAPASDGEFIVATGAGTFTYESGATARTSLGVDAAGTDNSTDVTLNTATADYLSIDGSQVITLSRLDLADDLATFTSANLAGRLTDETGTGNVVFSASPTFTGIAQFASLIANGSSTISNLTFTTATGTTLVLGGDTVTDLTGTGLTLSGTSLTTTLGTDISVGELDFDPIEEGELDTEAELESQLTGVTNVFTNNDTITAANIADVYLLNTGDTATGDYTFGTDILTIDSTLDRVGVGTSSLPALLTVADRSAYFGSLATSSASSSFFYISNGELQGANVGFSGTWHPLVTEGSAGVWNVQNKHYDATVTDDEYNGFSNNILVTSDGNQVDDDHFQGIQNNIRYDSVDDTKGLYGYRSFVQSAGTGHHDWLIGSDIGVDAYGAGAEVTNMVGHQVLVGSAATTTLSNVYGARFYSTVAFGATAENTYGIYSVPQTGTGSVIETNYGLYLDEIQYFGGGTVNTSYGVYQAGSTDSNYFAGQIGIGTTSTSTTAAKLSIQTTGTNDILNLFETAGTEVFTVLENGNIGIGTSSPSRRLAVSGDAIITGALYDNVNSAGTNGMVLQSTGSGFAWVATSTLGLDSGGSSLTVGTVGQIPYANSGGTDFNYSSNFTYSNIGTVLMQAVGASDILDVRDNTGAAIMRVMENGNVGIGTSTPSSRLFLQDGDLTIQGGGIRYRGAGGGINTEFRETTGNSSAQIHFLGGNGAIAANNDLQLAFRADGASADIFSIGINGDGVNEDDELLRLIHTGELSLGTTSSPAQLAVQTTGTTDILNLFETAGAEVFTVLENGNVGVGSTSPSRTLTVAGAISIDDTTSPRSGIYLNEVLLASASTTAQNYFFAGAGTDSFTTAQRNIGIGTDVLQNLTSGADNVVVGRDSMSANSSGSANVVLGALTATANSSGSNNVFIGSGVAFSNSTGAQNVALGNFSALLNNATGTIAIGYNAADNATAAGQSIFIGYDIDAQSTTDDFQLNIGNLIFGEDVDGTGGTISSGGIAIGTKVATTSRLTVQSEGTTDILNLLETAGTEVFTVLEDGNVGISNSAPTFKLHVDGGAASSVAWFDHAGDKTNAVVIGNSASLASDTGLYLRTTGAGYVNTGTGGDLHFADGAVTNAMINGTTGFMGIGTENPAVRMHVGSTSVSDSTSLLRLQDTNSTCDFDADTGSPSCGSDETLKKDISIISGELETVVALAPKFYRWKTESSQADLQSGFIAQEVRAILPELTREAEWVDGTQRLFLNTAGMMPYVVGAIGEQQQSLDELLRIGSTSASTLFADFSDGVEDTLWEKMVNLVSGFSDGVLALVGISADRITTDELCLNGDCIDDFSAVAGGGDTTVVTITPTTTLGVMNLYGELTIAPGATSTEVHFDNPYSDDAVVLLTPKRAVTSSWWVAAASTTGFRVELAAPETTDVVFAWHTHGVAAAVGEHTSPAITTANLGDEAATGISPQSLVVEPGSLESVPNAATTTAMLDTSSSTLEIANGTATTSSNAAAGNDRSTTTTESVTTEVSNESEVEPSADTSSETTAGEAQTATPTIAEPEPEPET